jgi:DNA-binding GntR family transcriptional regulator
MIAKSKLAAVKSRGRPGKRLPRDVAAEPVNPFDTGAVDFQPRYARVAQSLIEEIAAGKYPLGSLISTEAVLCEQFGISRNTARSALGVLSDMGLVSRHAGIGTVVRSLTAAPRYVHEAESVSALFPHSGATEQLTIHESDVQADAGLARMLACRRGQAWRQVEAVRSIRKHRLPVAYSLIYLPPALAHLSKRLHRLGPPSYTIIDRKSGFRVAKLIQETNACVVSARAARRLTVENDSPGLQVIRRYFDENGDTLMVADTIYPAGRYSFSFAIRLPRD